MSKTEQNVAVESAEVVDNDDAVITLGVPVKRGESVITSVRITEAVRQPGSLRGLKLVDLLQSDVDSVIEMIPRVTSPALMEHEIMKMDNADFIALSTRIIGFLVQKQG